MPADSQPPLPFSRPFPPPYSITTTDNNEQLDPHHGVSQSHLSARKLSLLFVCPSQASAPSSTHPSRLLSCCPFAPVSLCLSVRRLPPPLPTTAVRLIHLKQTRQLPRRWCLLLLLLYNSSSFSPFHPSCRTCISPPTSAPRLTAYPTSQPPTTTLRLCRPPLRTRHQTRRQQTPLHSSSPFLLLLLPLLFSIVFHQFHMPCKR
ncbi:unnamed protein product [Periconia digitata]|uniref:Uncharacterized protein n=1 Tax=Periconia digitata TaxID=1303443 RepID=A0A9W4U5P1_9PLEO|nr:unnamed protein product [Periconia digitata]